MKKQISRRRLLNRLGIRRNGKSLGSLAEDAISGRIDVYDFPFYKKTNPAWTGPLGEEIEQELGKFIFHTLSSATKVNPSLEVRYLNTDPARKGGWIEGQSILILKPDSSADVIEKHLKNVRGYELMEVYICLLPGYEGEEIHVRRPSTEEESRPLSDLHIFLSSLVEEIQNFQ